MGKRPKKLDIYLRGDVLGDENKRLEASNLSEANKEVLTAYQQNMLARGRGELRVSKMCMLLRKLARQLDIDFSVASRGDIEKLVAWIHSSDVWAESTKAEYKQALKQFYKFFKGDGEVFPPEVKWVSVVLSSKEKQFEELIQHEEALNLVYCCNEPRDKAQYLLPEWTLQSGRKSRQRRSKLVEC